MKFQNNNSNPINNELSQLMHELNNEKPKDRISIPTKNGYLIIRNQDVVHSEASDNYNDLFNDGGT